MKVTAKNINSLPEGMHRVDRCLYVRQREGKRPTFYFVYTILGKRKELSLGPVSVITITQARAKAAEYHHLLETGVDPQAAKKEKLRSMRDAGSVDKVAYTFADLLREALPTIENAKRWRNAKHRAQWQSTLETYALPVLGPKPVEDITRDDVLAVLRPIWDSKSETASRLRGRLEAVFSYAIATGKRVAANPATWRGNLDLFLPPPSRVQKVEHHEALSLDETRALLEEWNPPKSISASAIVFGILTASRVGEFVKARWDEIDFDARVWSVPPERRKDQKPYPHRVPLSDQAVYILSQIERKGEYVFARSAGSHISLETPRVCSRRRSATARCTGSARLSEIGRQKTASTRCLQKKASCMQPATRSNKRINVLICSSKGGPLCRHGLTRSCQRSDIFREHKKSAPPTVAGKWGVFRGRISRRSI